MRIVHIITGLGDGGENIHYIKYANMIFLMNI